MLDKSTVINTVERYADAVTKELAPDAVVLFGSYANDNAHEDSDIDVAVIFDGFTGDWLKTASFLWRLRRGISFDIEPILLDRAQDKSGFVANIFKTGQVIYRSAETVSI
jgi:predicted nucleotidyltransferase